MQMSSHGIVLFYSMVTSILEKLVIINVSCLGPPGTGKTSLCKALAQKLCIRLSERCFHIWKSNVLFLILVFVGIHMDSWWRSIVTACFQNGFLR